MPKFSLPTFWRVLPLCGAALLVVPNLASAQVIDPKDSAARTIDSASPDLPKIVLDEQQRTVLRGNVKRRSQAATSGSGDTARIAVGDAVAPGVTLERFPEIVYDEAPTLRTLQYYATERDIVIVEPTQRRVVAVIQ